MEDLTRRVLEALDDKLKGNNAPHFSELDDIARSLGAELHNGATRWAFVFKKHQVVYKFPRWSEVDDDYCELEMKNYELGKKHRIERCLLPISKVGVINGGLPIYLQPMYTTSHENLDRNQRKRWERKVGKLSHAPVIRKIRHGCYSSPTEFWVSRATQIYGKAFMRSFQAWSKEGKVGDLHSGNIGYLGKQPIIIDYAGYHG